MEYSVYREKVWHLFSGQIREGNRLQALIYLHAQLVSEIQEVIEQLNDINDDDDTLKLIQEWGDCTWYSTNIMTMWDFNVLDSTPRKILGLDEMLQYSIQLLTICIKSFYHNKPFKTEEYLEKLAVLTYNIFRSPIIDEILTENIKKLETRHGSCYNPAHYQK